MRRVSIVFAGLVLAAAGCGGDGGGGEPADGVSSNVLEDAVAKTEAAGTGRMDVTMTVSGGESASYTGEILVDFENDRNQLTLDVEGQTIQLFSDGSEEYVRLGTSGRYEPLPASADTPVANNPTDSLKYLGTDVVGVTESDESGCYEGELDYDRIIERVEAGRESEVPEGLRGLRAPVLVCMDAEGRIRRYDVEVSASGTTVDVKTTMSDYGESPSLEPLGPDERPR